MKKFNIILPESWAELTDQQLLMVYRLFASDLPADFEKVPFEEFLYVENLFQGYLNTQSDELLLQMAQVLYASDHVKPIKAHLVGIFYWIASLKQYFASQFQNFYKPATNTDANLLGSGQPDTYRQLRESTNAMIRALTGGDIGREKKRVDQPWFSKKILFLSPQPPRLLSRQHRPRIHRPSRSIPRQ